MPAVKKPIVDQDFSWDLRETGFSRSLYGGNGFLLTGVIGTIDLISYFSKLQLFQIN